MPLGYTWKMTVELFLEKVNFSELASFLSEKTAEMSV